MIEIKSLIKKYPGKLAVDNVSFSIGHNETVGLLGANGAGKSTIMNMIAGYIAMTSGTITVDGLDILEEPIAVRKKIGYLPEQAPLYGDMTVNEYLNFVHSIKRITTNKRDEIRRVCSIMDILDVEGRLIRHLSKGYKQRVGFAQALLGEPAILILDEPTSGLDPNQIIEFRKIIEKLGKKHTIILSTHILSEVENICQRILVMDKGKLVADDKSENLQEQMMGSERIKLSLTENENDIKEILKPILDIKEIKKIGQRKQGITDYIVLTSKNSDSLNIRIEITKRLAQKGIYVIEMQTQGANLEEIFQNLTLNKNEEVIK